MKVTFLNIFLVFVLSLSAIGMASLSHADSLHNMSEERKIELLIGYIGEPGHVFIRNGKEYNAKVAQSHVRKKLEYAGSRIKTARDFIRRIGSKSYFTGSPYIIAFPNGKRVKTGDWLHQKLSDIESNFSLSTVHNNSNKG